MCKLLLFFQNITLLEAFFSHFSFFSLGTLRFDQKIFGLIQSFLSAQYPYPNSIFAFLNYCLLFCAGEQINESTKNSTNLKNAKSHFQLVQR